jgi:mono/diheme cytochrome c family protein
MRTHKLNHDFFQTWLSSMAVAGLLVACGGGDKAPAGGSDTAAGGGAVATPPAPADTQTPAASGDEKAAPAGEGGKPSAAQIALGDSIFHGQAAGGTCYACHGQDGKGSAVGPNLTDSEWLNTDGSLEGLVKTIQTGVPTPKKAPAPMPPMGGASLTPEQVRAVAAYEYSLSHGGGKS